VPLLLTHIEIFLVLVVDKPVSYDTETLVSPDTHKLLHLGEPVRRRQTQAVVDT